MNYNLIILPLAKQDIKETANWYNTKQKDLGKKFIKAIRKEAVKIKKNPLLYKVRYDNIRTALIEIFPYLIHFSIQDTTIIIKAVYHTSRDSEIWIERI